MSQPRFVATMVVFVLVGSVLVCTGCQANVDKPSFVDLTSLVASVNERPELQRSSEQGKSPITVVIAGAGAQRTKLADWWSFLGEPKEKRSLVGNYFAAMGVGDRISYSLETTAPLGTYIEQAVGKVAESRGFVACAGAPRTLVVSLDEFWLDNTSSQVIRKAKIVAGVEVIDAEAQASTYMRGVNVESSFASDQSHVAVTLGGALLASFVGIGPSGEGMMMKADAEAAVAALRDVLIKLQDELAADQELWDALD